MKIMVDLIFLWQYTSNEQYEEGIMKIRLLISLMIVLSFGATNMNLVSAQAQGQTPIHLKVNDHYVLYTYPASPFVDKKGDCLYRSKRLRIYWAAK